MHEAGMRSGAGHVVETPLGRSVSSARSTAERLVSLETRLQRLLDRIRGPQPTPIVGPDRNIRGDESLHETLDRIEARLSDVFELVDHLESAI